MSEEPIPVKPAVTHSLGVIQVPTKYDDAVKYDTLSMSEVLAKGLAVMDSTAAAMCKDNKMPVLVFSLEDPENIYRAVMGENIGTVVYTE